MSTQEHPAPRRPPTGRSARPGRRAARALAALSIVVAACSGGGGTSDPATPRDDGPNRGPIPTLAGGLELGELDPAAVLVGDGIAFGSPLPSERDAADALAADAGIRAALARRAHDVADGSYLAAVVVASLDGARFFDEGVLGAFVEGAVRAAGGGPARAETLAGAAVLRAADPAGGLVAVGFREANLLVLVSGRDATTVERTATAVLEARRRGEVGSATPVTPLVEVDVDAVFVEVPTVAFAPIPPPAEEPIPEAPVVEGARAVAGRYGVTAGERRTVVWAIAVDLAAYASAEALDPVMRSLVSARAGGADPVESEVGDRVVLSASGAPDDSSAQVFRHANLVVVVEGSRADYVDAVTTAWIVALG